MASTDGANAVQKGTKRKHGGDDGVAKLTPSQRIAAARKAGTYAEFEGIDHPVEKREKAKTGVNTDEAAATDGTSRREPWEANPAAASGRRDDLYYRNLYNSELDFRELGEKDGDFAALLKGDRHLDFSDPASVMQLTKTLLKLDFGLQIDLPPDRLCPPVPNRQNYILWLKELLDSSSPSYSEIYEPDRQVTGLDIGTGASAIYPLLGCTQRQWSFIATDVDVKSLDHARKNVEANNLQSRIRIVESASAEDALIPLDDLKVDSIDFVMNNPPFYTSESELTDLANHKAQPPNSACTGAPVEMVCEGGEVGFIKRILVESLFLRERVQWYTAMLGKQSSLELIVDMLKEHDIDNYAITEFVQGNKTRRWAVGWSFKSLRPSKRACRGCDPSAGRKILPPLTEVVVASRSTKRSGVENLKNVFWTQLEDVTDDLDLVSWSLDEERLRGVGFADGNVWGRAYRRDKARGAVKSSEETKGEKKKKGVVECAFGFSISVQVQRGAQGEDDKVLAVVRWLQGTDFALFESFGGMLKNGLLNVV